MDEINKSKGRYDEAIKYFEKAAKAKPRNHNFPVKLGILAKKMGDFEMASQQFNKALKLKSDIPLAKKELAELNRLNKTQKTAND